MSSNLFDFSVFLPPPPLSPPPLFAPPSPAPATATAALQQCPICGRTQGPIDFIVHMMYDHPAFFAIWADYSNGNLFSSTTTNAFTAAALEHELLFGEDTGFENDADDAERDDAEENDQNDDEEDDEEEDGYDDEEEDAEEEDAEADAETDDPPTPSYEQLLLLCETIGNHPVGVHDVNAVAPIVSAPTDPTTRCTICLESMADLSNIRKITKCRHEFCDPCLRRWFYDHHTCPVCKDDIPRSI